ncbi:hypothetical protein A6C57_25835 [Fibrella sp. ES10-3-2-2]
MPVLIRRFIRLLFFVRREPVACLIYLKDRLSIRVKVVRLKLKLARSPNYRRLYRRRQRRKRYQNRL